MNREQINKIFFEDLHEIQMNQINTSNIEEARKVILNLLLYVQSDFKNDIPEKDKAIAEGLRWINKNTS